MNDKQISIGLLVMYCKETHSVENLVETNLSKIMDVENGDEIFGCK